MAEINRTEFGFSGEGIVLVTVHHPMSPATSETKVLIQLPVSNAWP